MAKSARARSTWAAGALSERLRRVNSLRSSAVSGRRGSVWWRDMGHLGARGSPHHYTSSHGKRPTSRAQQVVMSSSEILEPSFYRHWIEDRVRFADLDPLGHCNNAAIGGFFESSRIALFAEAGYGAGGGALSIPIVRIEIDFRRELHYGTRVRSAARPHVVHARRRGVRRRA